MLQFINGKAEVKQGRKVVAKVYDRAVFYPAHNIKSQYQYPFAVSVPSMGGDFECTSLAEATAIVQKYAN